MSTTFDWNITRMVCEGQVNGLSNVVVLVQWKVTGTQIVNSKTYTANFQGNTPVTLDTNSNFTPYEQLSKSQVLNWVWDSTSKHSNIPPNQSTVNTKTFAETAVQTRLDALVSGPAQVDLPLPWA